MISLKWITVAAAFLCVMLSAAMLNSSFPLAVIGFTVAVPAAYISKTKAAATGQTAEDELTWKI